MLRFCSLFLILSLCPDFFGLQFRQEGAVIKNCNPKYVTNCSTMTKRHNRGEPYRTNLTGTSLHTWDNNVTIKISYKMNGQGEMIIKQKICDSINKNKWFFDYLKTFSNFTKCPLPAGTYRMYNMEFPPKNFPWAIPRADVKLKCSLELTDTQEQISEFHINLHA